MNIKEKYFCSRCLRSLEDEGICPHCGHDPRDVEDNQALEEGTVIGEGRFQIGAVYRKKEDAFIYGAYDHYLEKPVFIVEYFPKVLAKRRTETGDRVVAEPEKMEEYKMGMETFCRSVGKTFLHYGRWFEENDTVYFSILD